MLPPDDLDDLLADLRAAFPRQQIDRDTIRVYRKQLSDLPVATLGDVLQDLVRQRVEPWFPTVGEIRQAVSERILALPTEAEALAQIESRIEWARRATARDEQPGDPPPVHELARLALDNVGGYPTMRGSESPTIVRNQFLKAYRQLREATVKAQQVNTRALAS